MPLRAFTHALLGLTVFAQITVAQEAAPSAAPNTNKSPSEISAAPATEAEKLSYSLNEIYIAAFNKADTFALGALYAEDAQYTTDQNTAFTGRVEVMAGLSKFFRENAGASLQVKVESARFLTPEVLLEKGLATIGGETTRYHCTYVKRDSAWLISELHETILPPADAGTVALNDLAWLLGEWRDNVPGFDVKTSTSWTKQNRFLARAIRVAQPDGSTVEATEVIGYDPAAAQVRSWVFDSEGGFGEGLWRREGNKWIISIKTTGPDGATATAQNVITYVSDDKYTWESLNRQSEGEVLPSIDKIEVIRTTGE